MVIVPVAKRIVVALAVGVLTVCVVGCGGAGTATGSVTLPAVPTSTSLPTATPSPAPTATPLPAASDGTCQPDPDGIYSSQTSFVTSLNAPLPAPPKTKHGIGSTGVEGGVTEGGDSGACTIGTFATITQFYTTQLPAQGWQYTAPPSVLGPCFHGTVPSKVWWKSTATSSDTFSWYDGGSAGGGSVFWSYTYCSVQS